MFEVLNFSNREGMETLKQNYTDSLLWEITLKSKSDSFEKCRKYLRDSYESTRDNAIEILDQIKFDFPNLTLHDITHVDSLWNTASVIIGNKCYIS